LRLICPAAPSSMLRQAASNQGKGRTRPSQLAQREKRQPSSAPPQKTGGVCGSDKEPFPRRPVTLQRLPKREGVANMQTTAASDPPCGPTRGCTSQDAGRVPSRYHPASAEPIHARE